MSKEALAKQEQGEPVACLVGTKGSAFDTPETKRAYTYAEQPNNVVAYKLGKSCAAAANNLGGDSIDAGLSLLKELQADGFGVFDLGAEYTTPPQSEARGLSQQQRKPLTDAEIRKWWSRDNGLEDCDMCQIDDFTKVVREVEDRHGIKE
jgi:hypothetical protein